ncbi:PhnD/SsuA/transferrin family substrate-binding protein [Rhodoblastus sp.]|uniref:sensor histidine kinase n=1 Tax=Rhodoblastus sp. TaxID=1962975 RepID=UPI00261BF9C5|nr:PhnD/SsuA/transferrin family substrate-binding protein [Rhodoblastus sp.]
MKTRSGRPIVSSLMTPGAMVRRLRSILPVAAALALWIAPCAGAEHRTEVRIGVLAFMGPEEAESAWGPTLDDLNAALPEYHFTMSTGSISFLTAAVAAHRLDFLITNPGHYLELKIDYSAVALATEQDLDGPPARRSVGSTIVALNRRLDLQRLEDLKGRKLAAVAPDTFGFRAAALELLGQGVDPFQDAIPLFVGYPVSAMLDALRQGRADAGIIRSCALEELIAQHKVGPNEFKVLGHAPDEAFVCKVSTRLYPGWAFVKVAQTPEPLAKAVAGALLAMQPGRGDKFWTEPDDYQSVQDLYRTLKIGPYAPFTRLGMAELIWTYRYAVFLAAMAAIWTLVHVIRVAYLIKRRTRQLEEAHELVRLKDAKMEHALRLSLMGEMASSLAHEINQPLAAILSYARGCERRLARGENDEGVRDALGRIATQAQRAGDIVRRMREFVRKNPTRQEPTDPVALFQDALALFEPSAASRELRVEADIPSRLPMIRADRLQIEEVTINLLQNALEAVDGQIDKQVTLAVVQKDSSIVITVTDNGPGLAPDARERLFEAFYTTKPGGLGLGLSLSRSIIESHGGQLSADDRARPGAIFRFHLPIANPMEQKSLSRPQERLDV